MIISILGIIFGCLITVSGIIFLVKEKADPESRKIYTVFTVIGAVITAAAVIYLIIRIVV